MSRTEVRLSTAELPSWDGVLPPYPGELEGEVFVRRAPASGGQPALFVHGLGGASTNWTDLMGLLAPTLDCAALDLPGFGWSPPAASYTLRTHVRAVVQLLERQGRGPVHLFGNSLGGAVATRVAARRPDLVRSLTLISPALPNLRPKKGLDPRLPLLALPGMQKVLRRMNEVTPEQQMLMMINLCYSDPSVVPQQRRQEAIEEVVRRQGLSHGMPALVGSLRGLIASYLQRGPRSLWHQAASVRVPTLLIWGSEDRLVDVALAPKALAAFPHSRLLVLPSVGHVAQLEQPETVARAFLALVEDADAKRVRA
ncbi:MAG: alpha/beta hydrolase fold protein [Frankiales bacterium]|nr:alpha/beta hydrolase fold protein [Frankiales bacterium]